MTVDMHVRYIAFDHVTAWGGYLNIRPMSWSVNLDGFRDALQITVNEYLHEFIALQVHR